MIRKILAILVVCLAVYTTSVDAKFEHRSEYPEVYESIIWIVARIKSFAKGFGLGFYGDMNEIGNRECIDDNTIDAIFNVFEGFVHGDGWVDGFFRLPYLLHLYRY